jgi:4a-hydroxytetrahydrobiopterin dehydratase
VAKIEQRLAKKKCVPCKGNLPCLTKSERQNLICQLQSWQIEEEKFLKRHYQTKDFKSALALANKVGVIAEEEGHHPDLLIGWGMLDIKIWTHTANGLTENDFILAAKIDQAMQD